MAPEVLDETIDITQFKSLKIAEIYSLGLVQWDTTRRCEIIDYNDSPHVYNRLCLYVFISL